MFKLYSIKEQKLLIYIKKKRRDQSQPGASLLTSQGWSFPIPST